MTRTAAHLIIYMALALGAVSCGGAQGGKVGTQEGEEEPAGPQIGIYGFVEDTLSCTAGTIASGKTFSGIMADAGMGGRECGALLEASKGVFNPSRLVAGKKYEVWKSPKTDSLKYVVYHQDPLRSTVFKCTPPYGAYYADKPVEHVRKYSDIVIESSLWNDISAAGASQLLAIELDNIFQWSVDFFGLQKGDRFRVLYSQSECEGKVICIDSVFTAIAHHGGKDIEAFLFPVEGTSNKYWDAEGASLKKTFLKAPLRFTRVSSGFSYARRNPVTHKVQPHLAVDYAAPSGTPVVSIGDGTVIAAYNSGAGGNMVKIRHNNRYQSAYLHLKGFAKGIKSGAHVSQGQVIGYVGSTGRSTGPHLDFRIWDNGKAVNPLKLVSPPAQPLKGAMLDSLQAAVPAMREALEKEAAKAAAL